MVSTLAPPIRCAQELDTQAFPDRKRKLEVGEQQSVWQEAQRMFKEKASACLYQSLPSPNEPEPISGHP